MYREDSQGNITLVTSPSPDEIIEPLMNTAEAAKFLNVSTAYVKDHCTRSKPYIRHVNFGTKKKAMRRFRRSDLAEFINGSPRLKRVS